MKRDGHSIGRREFLVTTALTTPLSMLAGCGGPQLGPALELVGFIGKTKPGSSDTPIDGATWFEAADIEDGLEFRVPEQGLDENGYLTVDMLLDGNSLVVFNLTLFEKDSERSFRFRIGCLNQCSLRATMPLTMVNLGRWRQARFGAFLKPAIGGDRIDLSKVERVTLTVTRKSPKAARWCMTRIAVVDQEPLKITEPVLPKGPLLDELGQSTLHDWPAKTRSVEELTSRIKNQLEAAPEQAFPESFSQWGGCKSKRLTKGSGFFATHHDGKRWWLVDPDGYAFWSQGPDCVRVGENDAKFNGLESALSWLPEATGEFADAQYVNPDGAKMINFHVANLIRTFGAETWREKWGVIALAELRRLRFNTVANWSDWDVAKEARFPYVRPMSFRPERSKVLYRGFPDVFDPAFPQDAADYASVLEGTAGDPAFFGLLPDE